MRGETAGFSRASWSAVLGGVVWVNLSLLAAAGYVSLELVERLFFTGAFSGCPVGWCAVDRAEARAAPWTTLSNGAFAPAPWGGVGDRFCLRCSRWSRLPC